MRMWGKGGRFMMRDVKMCLYVGGNDLVEGEIDNIRES